MAGFTTNKKTNHEIEQGTGYVRAGQGGVRHRFAGKLKPAPKDKLGVEPVTHNSLDSLGEMNGGDETDGDANLDMMGGEGLLDHDINAAPEPATTPAHHPHAPVAVHIHLGPSDHKAFAGLARRKK